MKSVRQWFDEVNDPDLKSKLMANLLPAFADDTLDSFGKEIDSLGKAINRGFYWGATPEGYAYWESAYSFSQVANN